MYLYWIVRNKDTCPGCDARRGVYTRRRCNRGAYSRAQRERERKKEKERERESGLEEAGNYFHKFRAALCGPLAWRARSLARAGARSVVDEFSLYGLASLPLQKNVSIQGARLIQTPVFIAAGSGGSFVFARPTRPVLDERARSLSCSFSCCVYHVWPRKHNTCTHTDTCTHTQIQYIPMIWKKGKYVKQAMNNSFHFLAVLFFPRQELPGISRRERERERMKLSTSRKF